MNSLDSYTDKEQSYANGKYLAVLQYGVSYNVHTENVTYHKELKVRWSEEYPCLKQTSET